MTSHTEKPLEVIGNSLDDLRCDRTIGIVEAKPLRASRVIALAIALQQVNIKSFE
ncbi:hypothetical protein [Allocoleopsis sp.]|uniref:hypothetical protein n=1 Tax=Allocoleopsis sp. TaxID=3088169 RepID=UPI002FD67FEC